MEVEQKLLAAIDQLAKDGSPGEIRCLAAFLACRGDVKKLSLGWQHPFRDFAEREGGAFQQHLRGLINRGIIVDGRRAIQLNSYIIHVNKNMVCATCAHRLFARAHAVFAKALRDLPFKEFKDLTRLQSHAACNRAHRAMGARYTELKRAGLLVVSDRTNPHIFPTLNWVEDVPWTAAMALTLEQGNALNRKNLHDACGLPYYLAVAMGHIEEDSDGKQVRLTEQGRALAAAHTADTLRKRLRWLRDCRPEAMHFLLDQLRSPLPAVWITGSPSQVQKTWRLESGAPLRILFKDWQLRMWIRHVVRRLDKWALARRISFPDGSLWYYFAPNVTPLAKEALELPAEPFALPPEHQVRFTALRRLLGISREQDGQWRLRLAEANPEAVDPADEHVQSALRDIKKERLVKGPAADGAYMVVDPDKYRWMVVELLMDPITEFLDTLPEEEEVAATT